jgi:hypothetical protein
MMIEEKSGAASSERVSLMAEARAIEEADGQWRVRHAAAVRGYSESFLRRSDCPRLYDVSGGSTTKGAVWYDPAEVRAWKAKRLLRPEERHGRGA